MSYLKRSLDYSITIMQSVMSGLPDFYFTKSEILVYEVKKRGGSQGLYQKEKVTSVFFWV